MNYSEFLDGIDRKAYHEGEWTWKEGDLTVTRTYQYSPPGCHETCGVLFYTDDNGKLVKVEGDPLSPVNNGKLCMRCLTLMEALEDPNRVKYPMKRAGERGENKWERISWDEAYDMIVEKVHQIWEESGPEAIVATVGTGRNVNWQIPFFAHVGLKTPNFCNAFFSGYACYLPRQVGAIGPIGDFFVCDASQANEQRYNAPEYKHSEVIVMWGCETLKSNADGFLGHWLVPAVQAGAKIISIDPQLTWWGARADYWLQIRPGTDAAMAMAMLNVIIEEDLYDHEFVDLWCAYLEDLEEHVKDATPEWAEEITGVPAEKIRGAARLYASGNNSTIQWGVAFDQQVGAFGAILGVCDLIAITGNLDVPGGNIIVRGAYECSVAYAAGEQLVPPEAAAKKLTTGYALNKGAGYVDFMANASADGIMHAIESGEPYQVRMMWIQSENIIACMGYDSPRIFEAMKNVEFVVNVDPVMTPTSIAFADLVLPVASGPERDSVRAWWTPLRATKKVCAQYYEAKSDEQICTELGMRLNPELYEQWGINDTEGFLNWFLHYGTGGNVESGNVSGGRAELDSHSKYYKDYKDLVEQGGYDFDEWNTVYKKYEKGMLRPDGGVGFATPTGRIELISTVYGAWGVTPWPIHVDPMRGPNRTPELMEEYPLVMTTGNRSWEFFHSEHRNLPTAREFHPAPLVRIHPADAEKYGIEDGQWVWIENGHGRCKQKAFVTEVMTEGIVSAEHGWWFPELEGAQPSLFGVFDANPNNLGYAFESGEGGSGADYKANICKIYPVEEGDTTPTQQVVELGGFGDYTPGSTVGYKEA
ncbi:MAG: molybdopterin-dependent oxidoreductase [Eggerthellaceae bacterium]|nr:molybdopterin-dependent oxidoreductase [Eggerthellaceae bacterium]